MTQQRDNLIGVLQTIITWRTTILRVCLIALAGSALISLLLPNYYKSVTICYPASPELANPELLFGTTGQVTDYFGNDNDLDRIAEIANSNQLVDYMVGKFKLYEHYDIDSTTTKGQFKVREEFRELYSALKNEHDALEISVEDTDPKLAAEMANAARDKVDEMAQTLTKTPQARLLAAIEDNINRKRTELSTMGDTLSSMQQYYGIYDPTAQGEALATQLAQAEAQVARNRARLEVLEPNLNIPRDTIAFIKADLRAAESQRRLLMEGSRTTRPNDLESANQLTVRRFNEGLAKVLVVKDLHFQARKQLSYDLERYTQIKAVYNTSISAIHVVEKAEVPLRKSRPMRSLLVIGITLAAFVFTLMAALIADHYRDVKVVS
jgi:tyrosine-protein kinase Etk/Wzc